MQTFRSFAVLLAILCFPLCLAAPASAADPAKLLLGTWKVVKPAKDGAGNNCPFVPDTMEFFGDGTMTMSNMPGGRPPFKTDLTPGERQAMDARDPSLKGKNLILVKPMPQIEWSRTPMVYSYTVTKKELYLTVTGWTPATFQRVK